MTVTKIFQPPPGQDYFVPKFTARDNTGFYRCDFTGATTAVDIGNPHRTLTDARFHRCKMADVVSRFDKLDSCHFIGCDLTHTDFRRTHLTDCVFNNCYMHGALFNGASVITNTVFRHCNLAKAEFQGAVFQTSKHQQFDETYDDFYHCDVTHADFDGAYINDAIFRYCFGVVDAGFDWRGYRFLGFQQEGGGTIIKAGCRWFTYAEAINHWTNVRPNSDARARMYFIHTRLCDQHELNIEYLAPASADAALSRCKGPPELAAPPKPRRRWYDVLYNPVANIFHIPT